MKILCLLVRHGTAAYPDALPKLDAWYERHGLRARRTLWIIDNQLPPETAPQTLAPDVILRAGDNSCGEFSAWDRALREARAAGLRCDLVHFVTSAFNVLFTGYLDYFDPRMPAYVLAHNACLGHIDRYDVPVKLEGVALQDWIRTCFFFLPATAAFSLTPWATYRDPARFFATPGTCKFRRTAPLSPKYRKRITAWLSGQTIGGHVWHSPIRAGHDGQTARFQQKTLAILNEHQLAVTLRKAGVRLTDFCWLWSHRASPVEKWPAPPPEEKIQITLRNRMLWGRLPKNCLAEVLRELANIPQCQGEGKLRLEQVSTNPQRIDFRSRLKLRVLRDDRCLCFVTVGYNLTDLWDRTRAFAAACPAIACKPLFRHTVELLDCVGVECFEGLSLEETYLSGRITAPAVASIAAGVVAELNRTTRPSSRKLAAAEFEQLAGSVSTLPFLNGLDRDLIKNQIIPYIKKGLLAGPWHTRWTNGDLIPANVLVNDQGAVRLIDYEFAAPTHFPADDWWRWRTFSRLKGEARELPMPPGSPDPATRGQEALFVLRHLVLTSKVVQPGRVPGTVRDQIRQLIKAATAGRDPLGGSFLLSPTIEDANLLPELQQRLARLEPDFHLRLKELNALYARTEALKNERNLLKAELAEMRKNLDNVEKERALRGKVIEDQGAKLSKLEGEFDKRLKELNALYAKTEAIKNERNLLQAQLADLQTNFAAVETDRNLRLKELNRLYESSDKLRNEHNLLQAQLADLQKNFAAAEEDRAVRGQVIEDQGTKLSRLEGEFDKRLKELNQLYVTAEALKNERNLLHAQLADLQTNFAAAEKDRAVRGQVIEEQGAKFSRLEAEFDRRLKELSQLYVTAETLKNERNLLQGRLADLQASFTAVEKDRETWKEFSLTHEETLKRIRAELADLSAVQIESTRQRDEWKIAAGRAESRAKQAEAELLALRERWWAKTARRLGLE